VSEAQVPGAWEERRVALVSGANRGLGLEISSQLARRGFHVLLGSRDQSRGAAAAEKLAADGLVVDARQLDVTDEGSVQRLVSEVRERPGRLDVLVNNAGVGGSRAEEGTTVNFDAVRRTLETNLFGAWRLCQAFIPLMRERGFGRIVNVSSGAGRLTYMNGRLPAYRVSKTALNAVTRILADELTGTGVLVNSADVGWVRTDMGGPNARSSVEQGADTPVWLATLGDDGPTGASSGSGARRLGSAEEAGGSLRAVRKDQAAPPRREAVTRAHARVGVSQNSQNQPARQSQSDRRRPPVTLETPRHRWFSISSTLVSKTVMGLIGPSRVRIPPPPLAAGSLQKGGFSVGRGPIRRGAYGAWLGPIRAKPPCAGTPDDRKSIARSER
jgi:NAD(P)-dependent dehydrogenase (short-subunit alcohol dehydrogenase family)